jgi:hypothetical protein
MPIALGRQPAFVPTQLCGRLDMLLEVHTWCDCVCRSAAGWALGILRLICASCIPDAAQGLETGAQCVSEDILQQHIPAAHLRI